MCVCKGRRAESAASGRMGGSGVAGGIAGGAVSVSMEMTAERILSGARITAS